MTKRTPHELEYVHSVHQLASNIRGEFLNGATWIEFILSDLLAHYFSPNEQRRTLFFSEVANGMTFAWKVAVLEKVVLREFPKFEESFPRFAKRLDKFREFRNVLAHNHIDTSKQALAERKPNEVTFILYRLGQLTRRRVTLAEAIQQAKNANVLRAELIELQRLVSIPEPTP
jgi:hypothetical protein